MGLFGITTALERRKQVRLRFRQDLEVNTQKFEGDLHYVVKDPVSLKYYRFPERDYFLIQFMDGQHTLDQARQAFEQYHAPLRLPLEDVESFGQQLLKMGLVHSDSPEAGLQLYERHRKTQSKKRLRYLTNILSIEIPVFDPDRLLGRLQRGLRWIYTIGFLLVSIGFMLGALLLVGMHYQTFWSKLPTSQEFFRYQNLLYLWLAIALVKILHEFGHGLTCKAFGGEVHNMGALLLCLSPCLYMNVSDSWKLKDKWKRILVGLAGIYVELMIASLATFVWWNTTNAWMVHNLCLSIIIVCSVSTIMFNGNPLLRYDGYYVLADWLEIPNLRERCNQYLKHVVMKHLLGMEVPPEAPMTLWRRIGFVVYAVASYVYGWVVTFGILWFLSRFLVPYKLGTISVLLACYSAGSMIGWPLYYLIKGLYKRGKLPEMKINHVALTTAAVAVGLLLFFFLPLPVSRIRQTALVQVRPDAGEKVFVTVAGILERLHVRDGQEVKKGDILAEFRSLDLETQLEETRSQHEVRVVQLKVLRRQASEVADPQERGRIESAITQTDGERKTYAKQLEGQKKALARLMLRAPRSGVVMNTPRIDEVGKLWEKDQGVPFCSIGDPSRLWALVPVAPADHRLLKDEIVQELPVTMRVKGWGGRTWRGKITALPESEVQDVPLALTTRCGGPLAVKPGNKPNVFVPQSQHYLVAIDFLEAEEDGIWPGTLGQVKIHCQYRSCAWWLWRTISSAFDLGLI